MWKVDSNKRDVRFYTGVAKFVTWIFIPLLVNIVILVVKVL